MVDDPLDQAESPFAPADEEPILVRSMPVLGRLRRYRLRIGQRDAVAGLTVAALALPSAMGYAQVAGLSPVHGLYALLLPCVAYALLGSSRQVIIGPEGALSALVAAAILPVAVAGSPDAAALAALLGLMIGGLFVLARLVRLAWIADYLSRPVLVGYIHGVVVVLIIGQLGKLLGVEVEALDPIPQLIEVLGELGDINLATVAVSVVTLAFLLGSRGRFPRLPAALLAVVVAIGVSSLLDLQADGVAVVGDVPAGLPSLSIPSVSLGDVARLIPAAIALFLVCLADGLLTARSFAGRAGDRLDASQELLALGVANAASGISQGMPVGVSGSRTAVNVTMQAGSQIAGLTAAAAVALVLVLLTDPISYLPKAVLGATIVAAAISLVELADWRSLRRTDPVEFAIAGVTVAGVVVSGVLEAIGLAVALSVVDVVRRSAHPHDAVLGWDPGVRRYADVAIHRRATTVPGIVVYRLDDRLFFANAAYVKGRVAEAIRGAHGRTHTVVFDAEGVTDVDSSGIEALGDLRDALSSDGIELMIARLHSHVSEKLVIAEPDLFSEEVVYPTVRAAVDAAQRRSTTRAEPT